MRTGVDRRHIVPRMRDGFHDAAFSANAMPDDSIRLRYGLLRWKSEVEDVAGESGAQGLYIIAHSIAVAFTNAVPRSGELCGGSGGGWICPMWG